MNTTTESSPTPSPAAPAAPAAGAPAQTTNGEAQPLRRVALPLHCNAQQQQALLALRELFTRACNELARTVAQTRCWNRVALHHMAYKPLREQFPQLGSQMACNVIYSVCRAARRAYQHPDSPHQQSHLQARQEGQPLPVLRFKGPVPVYFDRHTVSLKPGMVSLFTLDGRMRFQLDLPPAVERRFREDRLRETVLVQGADGSWALVFDFAAAGAAPVAGDDTEWPQYLMVSHRAPR